jgi:hypothetical protein
LRLPERPCVDSLPSFRRLSRTFGGGCLAASGMSGLPNHLHLTPLEPPPLPREVGTYVPKVGSYPDAQSLLGSSLPRWALPFRYLIYSVSAARLRDSEEFNLLKRPGYNVAAQWFQTVSALQSPAINVQASGFQASNESNRPRMPKNLQDRPRPSKNVPRQSEDTTTGNRCNFVIPRRCRT